MRALRDWLAQNPSEHQNKTLIELQSNVVPSYRRKCPFVIQQKLMIICNQSYDHSAT